MKFQKKYMVRLDVNGEVFVKIENSKKKSGKGGGRVGGGGVGLEGGQGRCERRS